MLQFLSRLSIVSFLVLGFSVSAQAALPNIFVSFVTPPEREVIVAPQGFQRCYEVESVVNGGVWINKHRVCEYQNAPYGGMWVAGHWECAKFKHHEPVCKRWVWVPSRWIKEHGHHHHHHHSGNGWGTNAPANNVSGWNSNAGTNVSTTVQTAGTPPAAQGWGASAPAPQPAPVPAPQPSAGGWNSNSSPSAGSSLGSSTGTQVSVSSDSSAPVGQGGWH